MFHKTYSGKLGVTVFLFIYSPLSFDSPGRNPVAQCSCQTVNIWHIIVYIRPTLTYPRIHLHQTTQDTLRCWICRFPFHLLLDQYISHLFPWLICLHYRINPCRNSPSSCCFCCLLCVFLIGVYIFFLVQRINCLTSFCTFLSLINQRQASILSLFFCFFLMLLF